MWVCQVPSADAVIPEKRYTLFLQSPYGYACGELETSALAKRGKAHLLDPGCEGKLHIPRIAEVTLHAGVANRDRGVMQLLRARRVSELLAASLYHAAQSRQSSAAP